MDYLIHSLKLLVVESSTTGGLIDVADDINGAARGGAARGGAARGATARGAHGVVERDGAVSVCTPN